MLKYPKLRLPFDCQASKYISYAKESTNIESKELKKRFPLPQQLQGFIDNYQYEYEYEYEYKENICLLLVEQYFHDINYYYETFIASNVTKSWNVSKSRSQLYESIRFS